MNLLVSFFGWSEFIDSNIFGYLFHALQIFAAEVLCGIYLKRRNHFWLRAVCAFVLFLSLSVAFGLLFEKIFIYFRYLISFPISFLCFAFCYEGSFWDDLFCCTAAIAIQNLAYSVSIMTVGILGAESLTMNFRYVALECVIYASVHVLCFFLGVRKLKNESGDFGKERFVMTLTSLIFTVIVYILQHDRQELGTEDFLQWRLMFIAYDAVTLVMLFGMYDRNNLRRENAVLDLLRASEEQQYEFEKLAIEMVNIKCHDLKHQILALRSMAGGEMQQSLDDMERVASIYDSVAKTGCKPLDVILSNKYLLCEQLGIRFTYMVEGEKLLFMNATDIYSLFGNAIDNAIQAESTIQEEDKRLINLTVVSRGELLRIHIENYCEVPVKFKNGLPVTTQADTNNHGFGMISMKRTAERYNGVMTVECVNKMFCVDMIIPIQAAGDKRDDKKK